MKSIYIHVYALKSNRKNAKSEEKTFQCFPDAKKLKKSFSKNDIAEIQEWAIAMESKGLKYFQVVISDGTNVLANEEPIFRIMHDFLPKAMDSFKACTLVMNYMDLPESVKHRTNVRQKNQYFQGFSVKNGFQISSPIG